VKVLRPDVLGGAERFLREIEVVSSLVHPNIMPLYESGSVDGAPYYTKSRPHPHARSGTGPPDSAEPRCPGPSCGMGPGHAPHQAGLRDTAGQRR
jgi:hypothetical protein